MNDFQQYRIEKINNQSDEFALVLYLDDYQTEFAIELGVKPEKRQNLLATAKNIVSNQYPKLKVTMVKVVLGGMVITSFQLAENTPSASAQSITPNTTTQQVDSNSIYYQVSSGDTLWSLSQKYKTTVQAIKQANNLSTDALKLNQKLIIPLAIHTVKTGDYISVLARDYGTSVNAIKEANTLSSDNVRIGQTLIIPMNIDSTAPTPPTTTERQTVNSRSYTVVSGDSLSVIAERFGVSTDALRTTNNISGDLIRVGQVLSIPEVPVTASNTGTATENPPASPTSQYTVVAGDTLYSIARNNGLTVDAIRAANNLSTDLLKIGQVLIIPGGDSVAKPAPTVETPPTSYTVVAGDTLWGIASRFGTTTDALRNSNNLQTDILQPGQVLTISSNIQGATPSSPDVQEAERKTFTYRVVSGDNLTVIASRFGVTVDAIRSMNNLKTDDLQVGQALTIPNGIDAPVHAGYNSITYKTHIVASGDNLWDLSVRYGIPQAELLRVNQLTTSSRLSIGQKLTIPVHNIGVKETVSANHGELMDWWTEAQYLFPIGKTAKITDLDTGKSFYIKRTVGANHADSETLTLNDTNIAKSIWGGFSWKTRAVIVEVDGRKLAASMSFMPHEREYVANNGITGHFDVYFSNSTRHVDGKPDPLHQAQVERAAGIR